MQLLEWTLPTAAENLAADEALLESLENDAGPETLRIWESPQTAVVIGRSSVAADEVDLAYCRRHDIPVLRRASGGAAVAIGPGCLMYALALRCDLRPELREIAAAHCWVLRRIAAGLQSRGCPVTQQGASDLECCDRKFSGNSMRLRRRAILYHGTLLYDFRLETIAGCLRTAPRQPEWRRGREHDSFVANLPLDRAALRQALLEGFAIAAGSPELPNPAVGALEALERRTAELTAQKYSQESWNLRR